MRQKKLAAVQLAGWTTASVSELPIARLGLEYRHDAITAQALARESRA
jgi:hypothetical protein